MKAGILRGLRSVADSRIRLRRYPQGDASSYPFLLSQSRTPLWTAESAVEQSLQLGKIQNLRRACRRLNLAEIPARQIFSFWKQIGKAKRSAGYTKGRELRQGCLIPTVGGGLCQLSNSLYDAALKCGCEIVERHAHTAVVPGSAAQQGRDATVFWNYVDLRFICDQDLLITARLSSDELCLQFWGKQSIQHTQQDTPGLELFPAVHANTCTDCGQESCFRHVKNGAHSRGHSAFLIEECWPEFNEFCRKVKSEKDELLLPWSSAWRRPQRYGWDANGYSKVVGADLPTMLASIQTKLGLAADSPAIAAQIARSERLAEYYSKRISSNASYLYVAQTLLPFLWRAGHLGGRRFVVFMTRLPLHRLHPRLDELARQFPEQKTFQEFRAPEWMAQAEAEALTQAESLVTPHGELARIFPQKTQKLNWMLPRAANGSITTPKNIVFPGPTAARKGAYQLREALRDFGKPLVLLGNNLEGTGFWQGANIYRLKQDEDWLHRPQL